MGYGEGDRIIAPDITIDLISNLGWEEQERWYFVWHIVVLTKRLEILSCFGIG